MILVLAGNYDQFKYWVEQKKIDLKKVKYISIMEDIYGHEDVSLELVGTWREDMWKWEAKTIIESIIKLKEK